jgi:tetratricopeptide (TPR) repeat protein
VKSLVARAGCALIVAMSWLALPAQNTSESQTKVGALEQQIQRHLQEQKPELAIPLLREVVSLDPKNVNAQANLGVLLSFQGNYAEAIPHMRAALELRPDLWRIEALLGIAEKRTGDPIRARSHLEEAFSKLDDQKIQIQAGLELIELHSASAQLDKAAAVAAKLGELAPQNPQILLAAYQISRQTMYRSLLSMMLAAADSAEMHMIMGGELGREGDHADAITQYREAIRLNPMLPGAHFELAEQLRTSPDKALNEQAEGEYRAALRVNQYDELSWRQLGGVIAAKGEFKAAEEHYQRALALQPNDSEAKTGLAIVFISTNRQNEAMSLLESAVRDDPTNTVAHFRLSGLYRRAGRNTDAERELDTFRHYQDLKEKLGKAFKQLAAPGIPR